MLRKVHMRDGPHKHVCPTWNSAEVGRVCYKHPQWNRHDVGFPLVREFWLKSGGETRKPPHVLDRNSQLRPPD